MRCGGRVGEQKGLSSSPGCGQKMEGERPGFTLEQGHAVSELVKMLQRKTQSGEKLMRCKRIKLESSNKSGRMFWVYHL